MADNDGRHFGKGVQGKGDGSGGMVNPRDDLVGENDVLSNRDKSRHTRERGQDSKWVQVEQGRDTAANKTGG